MQATPVEGRRRTFGLRGWLIVAAVVLVILLLSLRGLARFYTDYLWFKDVGYQHTWRSLLSAKIVPAVIFSAAFFIAMLINLIVADRVAPRYRGTGPEDEIIERYRSYVQPYAGRVRVLVSLFFALIMGTGVSAQWQHWILFSNSTSFGIKDQEFHKDISFYVFRLPFLQFVAGWIFAALLVILIVSAVFHYLNGGIRLQSPFQRVTPQVKVHLSVLLAIMALTKTYQYYLAQFALTRSRNGFVDGATYTDLHAHLPALRLLMVISVAAAGLFIVNIWRRGWVFPIIAVGLWGFISIVVGTIYPAVIQKFTVQPNELARETPYIERNIAATRDAFNLNDKTNITTNTFDYNANLDKNAVAGARTTLQNVRLYDPLPAQDAFRQQEEILPFYAFTDVDVDRYTIGDEPKKPILASVRELNLGQLPDNSWTSQHLVYTHGFGAVAAAANDVATDQPSYVLRGIPPSGDLKDALDQQHTGVYFGEGIGGYSVVDTKVAEQEAVGTGGTTKATSYQGAAGVKVSSFLRRAALALRFGDWNLLVSGQVTNQSRVIYIRDIQQRVQQIAPFLKYDADPYPVISGGRIIWVIDAYTTTDDYPYSQSIHPTEPRGSGLDSEFNYVRNSVKVTVDAYDGTVKFYVFDPNDPIIKTYRKAFPELFQDKSAMPDDLQKHMRYPEDIFSAQTEQYALYHITDPVQYFNKQSIWDVAPSPDTSSAATVAAAVQSGSNGGRNTTLAPTGSPIDPIYLTMGLPDKPSDQQFLLERSFTPRSKGAILSAFMFAESDPENYGKLVLFQVPNTSAPSPGQAASLIQSDQFISSQFTLLGTQGSRVITGNVQLIPVGNAIVYVRPVWILGSGSATFPRYLAVAAALGSRAVLGTNMQDAITALLTNTQTQFERGGGVRSALNNNQGGTGTTTTTTTVPGGGGPPPTNPPPNASVNSLLQAAQREFALANAALANQDLAGYQRHNAAAQALVDAAAAKSGAATSPTTAPPTGPTPTTRAPVTTTTGAP